MESSKVFFDTNCFLDIFLNREPNVSFCRKIFEQTDVICISAVTVTNACYIAKVKDNVKFEAFIDLFEIIDLTKDIVSEAFRLDWKDYEDAVQFVSAASQCDVLITSNIKDFQKAKGEIKVVSPRKFLATF